MSPRHWRHVPERPRGFYAAYLDELIERNRAKREAQGLPPASDDDDEYWNERRRNEALKDQPKAA
jgi:hypothetical protein